MVHRNQVLGRSFQSEYYFGFRQIKPLSFHGIWVKVLGLSHPCNIFQILLKCLVESNLTWSFDQSRVRVLLLERSNMVKYEKHILVGTYSRNEDLHCSHRSLLDVPEKSPSIRVPSSWSKCNSTNFLNIEALMAAMWTFVPTNDMPRMFSSTSCQFENNNKKIIGHSLPSTWVVEN